MNTTIKIFALAMFFAITFFSCKKDETKDPLQVPDTYDGANYSTNTVQEYELRSQLQALITKIQEARVQGVTVSASDLTALFNAGTLSLSQSCNAQLNSKIQGYFNDIAMASGGAYDATLTPAQNGEGGVYGGSSKYLFDENGLDLNEQVQKSYLGSGFYYRAATENLSGDITLEDLDKAIALFGAHPDFPNSNKAANHANPDAFLAGYAARRDDGSGNGVYLTVKKNFIKAQAAVKAGSDYNEERDEAIAAILLNWEKAMAATAINYCFSSITNLSSTTPDDATRAGALHGLTEASGFFQGLYPVANKKASNTSIENILTKLRNPINGSVTKHEFVKNPVQAVTDIEAAIALIKTEYGFTDAEVESFKLNQVNVREP